MVSTTISLDNKTPSNVAATNVANVLSAPDVHPHHHQQQQQQQQQQQHSLQHSASSHNNSNRSNSNSLCPTTTPGSHPSAYSPSSTSTSASAGSAATTIPYRQQHHHYSSKQLQLQQQQQQQQQQAHRNSSSSGSNHQHATTFDSSTASLNEKISILFPKCRPKSEHHQQQQQQQQQHQHQHQPQHPNNNQQQQQPQQPAARPMQSTESAAHNLQQPTSKYHRRISPVAPTTTNSASFDASDSTTNNNQHHHHHNHPAMTTTTMASSGGGDQSKTHTQTTTTTTTLDTMDNGPAQQQPPSTANSHQSQMQFKPPNVSTNPFLSGHATMRESKADATAGQRVTYFYQSAATGRAGSSSPTLPPPLSNGADRPVSGEYGAAFQPNSAVPTYTQKLHTTTSGGGGQGGQNNHNTSNNHNSSSNSSKYAQQPQQNPFTADGSTGHQQRGARKESTTSWEPRKRYSHQPHNTTPASTVLNSPDLLDGACGVGGGSGGGAGCSADGLGGGGGGHHRHQYASGAGTANGDRSLAGYAAPGRYDPYLNRPMAPELRVGRSPVNGGGGGGNGVRQQHLQQLQQQTAHSFYHSLGEPGRERFPTLSPSPSALVAGGLDDDELDGARMDESAAGVGDDRREDWQRDGDDGRREMATTAADHLASMGRTPTKMAVVADGEVVVFEDTGSNWQNLRISNDSPPHSRRPSPPSPAQSQLQQARQRAQNSPVAAVAAAADIDDDYRRPAGHSGSRQTAQYSQQQPQQQLGHSKSYASIGTSAAAEQRTGRQDQQQQRGKSGAGQRTAATSSSNYRKHPTVNEYLERNGIGGSYLGGTSSSQSLGGHQSREQQQQRESARGQQREELREPTAGQQREEVRVEEPRETGGEQSSTGSNGDGDSLKGISGIMEYDGSPRRFGQSTAANTNTGSLTSDYTQSAGSLLYSVTNLTSPIVSAAAAAATANPNNHSSSSKPSASSSSLFSSPRPGFPQRVLAAATSNAADSRTDATTAPTMSATPSIAAVHTDDTSNDISEMATSGSVSLLDEAPSVADAMGLNGASASGAAQLLLGSAGAASSVRNSTFDYLYEFSETRKVLEEFFKCPAADDKQLDAGSDVDSIDIHYEFKSGHDGDFAKYIGQRLASSPAYLEDYASEQRSPPPMAGNDGPAGQTNGYIGNGRQGSGAGSMELMMGDESPQHLQHHMQHHLQHQQQQQHYQHQRQTTDSPSEMPMSMHHHHLAMHHQQQQQPQQHQQQQQQQQHQLQHPKDVDYFLDSASRSSGGLGAGGLGLDTDSGDLLDNEAKLMAGLGGGLLGSARTDSRCFRYSPETTDYDSNCGDLDSLSGDFNVSSSSYAANYAKYYASMPILEDGLSSGHASDTENNNPATAAAGMVSTATAVSTAGMTTAGLSSAVGGAGGGISLVMGDMRGDRGGVDRRQTGVGGGCSPAEDGDEEEEEDDDEDDEDLEDDEDAGVGGVGSSVYNGGDGMRGRHGQRRSGVMSRMGGAGMAMRSPPHKEQQQQDQLISEEELRELSRTHLETRENAMHHSPNNKVFKNVESELEALYSMNLVQHTPPPPAPAPHRKPSLISCSSSDVQSTLKDIKSTLDRTKALTAGALDDKRQQPQSHQQSSDQRSTAHLGSMSSQMAAMASASGTSTGLSSAMSPTMCSPVWIPRHFDHHSGESHESEQSALKAMSGDEEEVDTDLETDRLLGHQRLEDHGFYDEKTWCERKPATRSLLSTSLSKFSPKLPTSGSATANNSTASGNQQSGSGPSINTNTTTNSILRQGLNALLPSTPELLPSPVLAPVASSVATASPPKSTQAATSSASSAASLAAAATAVSSAMAAAAVAANTVNTSNSTSKLLDIGGSMSSPEHSDKSPCNALEMPVNSGDSPTGSAGSDKDVEKKKKSKNKEVLIEGVLFRARYLGSTQLVCEGQPTKSTRMVQAEEAVSRIKAPDGEVQPSTEVDLFISTEKIMVLNTDLKEIMMDHALRTISYIADIGDLVVLMARRRFVPNEIDDAPKPNRTPKMICHVFESDEAQFIAQSIGQAFQVAYMEFLKANGIEDHSFVKEMDYQEVLNSQEIFGDELEIFAKKELQKEVVVPKAKGEILGVVIVESGWGSMLPTVVIANLLSSGAAARCGQLNIGDQIIAINGMSLVGLPLSTCQNYIKNTKAQTVVKFTVVPCAPVVEVKIKRPNTKYQLGFSVQNGVICSLLRGGIAERGGVRVGHRIIEINNQSVVAVPHEKIVNLLATSVGEILMKTMPTSMFRLLTGQENPVYI